MWFRRLQLFGAAGQASHPISSDGRSAEADGHRVSRFRTALRLRTLNAGETIDLTHLAHDQLSIRWDDRNIPLFRFGKWSLVPLAMISALLGNAASWQGGRAAYSGPATAISDLAGLLLGGVLLAGPPGNVSYTRRHRRATRR